MLAYRRLAATVITVAFPSFATSYWVAARRLPSAFGHPGRRALWTPRKLVHPRRLPLNHPWHLALGIGSRPCRIPILLGSTVIADNMYLSLLVETGLAELPRLSWFQLVRDWRASYRAMRAEDAATNFLGTWMLCFWIGRTFPDVVGDLLTYWRVLPSTSRCSAPLFAG